jgi:hypothetical protein
MWIAMPYDPDWVARVIPPPPGGSPVAIDALSGRSQFWTPKQLGPTMRTPQGGSVWPRLGEATADHERGWHAFGTGIADHFRNVGGAHDDDGEVNLAVDRCQARVCRDPSDTVSRRRHGYDFARKAREVAPEQFPHRARLFRCSDKSDAARCEYCLEAGQH